MMKITLLGMVLLLTACFQQNPSHNLQQFVDEVISQPKGVIEPIPEFTPYQFFRYQASSKRSPFLLPQIFDVGEVIDVVGTVEPDLSRKKQTLEAYSLNDIYMVGVLSRKQGDLWALFQTDDGLVHKVRSGNYIGKNHGRIMQITDQSTDVIEIVPNGFGGWMERPRSIAIKTNH